MDQKTVLIRIMESETSRVEIPLDHAVEIKTAVLNLQPNLPADLPTGTHMARAYLFRSGVFIRESSEPLYVRKSGFESYIDDMATRYGALYGVAAVLLAIFTGWFGRLVFKRD